MTLGTRIISLTAPRHPTHSRRLMRNDESLFRHETTISAMPGDRLSITLMMGQSNDWFYAPAESGIDLFQNGKAMSGDISPQLYLWNAGIEVDQKQASAQNKGRARRGRTPAKPKTASCRKSKTANLTRTLPACCASPSRRQSPRCNMAHFAILPTASAAWSGSDKSGQAAVFIFAHLVN